MARRIPSILSIQSHVVYGAAGNSAAVFPMRRLGANVWPLNTVQFSNHTQYGSWEGLPTPNEQISLLVDGIAAQGVLDKCDAVLSGYLGSAEQGGHVIEAVQKVKSANPQALYCCDPVMGHPEKGCIVPEGVTDFFATDAVAAADVMCPNVLELGILAGGEATNLPECIEAARSLIDRGPELILVKHLAHAGLNPTRDFEMLCVTANEVLHVATPLLPFDRPPVGTGDLTSGMFLVKFLRGLAPRDALEHTAGAYHAVMQATLDAGEYELQSVAAQDEIASPQTQFVATHIK
jgi:pyridoxine kinase